MEVARFPNLTGALACGWSKGDAVVGHGPRAQDSTEEVVGALLVGTSQTRRTTITPDPPLVREAGRLNRPFLSLISRKL